MESINVSFNDFKDFATFSNEQEILNSTEEVEMQVSKETGSNTAVTIHVHTILESFATLSAIATPPETELETPEILPRELADQVTREPSSRVWKNHPLDEIVGGVYKGRCTRDKQKLNYLEMLRYVCTLLKLNPRLLKRPC